VESRQKYMLFDIQMQWNWFIMRIFILGTKVGKEADNSVEKLLGYQELENTLGYFEDTVVVDSPLAETQLENLGFDSELVDDDYGEEVVPDSEDEGVLQGSVVNGLLDGKAGGRFKASGSSLCKRAEDVVVDSDYSNHVKSNAG
jgi:hypothetical protein